MPGKLILLPIRDNLSSQEIIISQGKLYYKSGKIGLFQRSQREVIYSAYAPKLNIFHLKPILSPLPSLTFYGHSPTPSFASFCDTRISSSNIALLFIKTQNYQASKDAAIIIADRWPIPMGIAKCFFVENVFKVFGLGQSDVCSGNSMTTCYVVNANILNTLIQLDNSKHRSRAISRPSEGKKIHVLPCSIDYLVPLSPCSRSPHNT